MDDKNFALLAIGILTFAAASMMAKGFASPFLSLDHVFFMTGSGILMGLSAGLLLTEVLDHGPKACFPVALDPDFDDQGDRHE